MSMETDETTEKTEGSWGGARKGAGRPKRHSDEIPVHTLWLRATDEEWAAFLAALPADSRERFLVLSRAAASSNNP